jgi:hypothetical protein
MNLEDLEAFLAGERRPSSNDGAGEAYKLIMQRVKEERAPEDTLEVLEAWLDQYPDHPLAEEGYQLLLQLLVDMRSRGGS